MGLDELHLVRLARTTPTTTSTGSPRWCRSPARWCWRPASSRRSRTATSSVITAGYVVMRLAMVAQWLRAARNDPQRRPTALRYAVGIAVVQVLLAGPAGRCRRPGPCRRSCCWWSPSCSCRSSPNARPAARPPTTRATSPSGTACSRSSCSARRSPRPRVAVRTGLDERRLPARAAVARRRPA